MAKAFSKPKGVALGIYLRGLRESRGIKASWIADRMGITKSMICRLEKGERGWTDIARCDYLDALITTTKPKRKTKHHGNKTNGNPRD